MKDLTHGGTEFTEDRHELVSRSCHHIQQCKKVLLQCPIIET